MILPVLKLILATTNLSILSFLFVLMVDHYNNYNNFRSWGSIFHILCFLWLTMRGTFWLLSIAVVDNPHPLGMYVLYWMTNPIEFGSFMLLPLFFAQVMYPQQYSKYAAYIKPTFITLVAAMIGFTIYVYILEKEKQFICLEDTTDIDDIDPNACYTVDQSNAILRMITGVCFILLAILQGSYGLKITYLEKIQYDRFFAITPYILGIVNIILVLSFFTRGVYQFVSTFSQFELPSIPIQGTDDVDFVIVLVFLLWDYLPTMLLIVTVTSRHVGSKPREGGLIRGLGVAFNSTPLLRQYGSISTNPIVTIVDKTSAQNHRDNSNSKHNNSNNDIDVEANITANIRRLSDNMNSNNVSVSAVNKKTNSFEKGKGIIDLRGLERFDAPSNLSPQGSWLGVISTSNSNNNNNNNYMDISSSSNTSRIEKDKINAIMIGSPQDFYLHTTDSNKDFTLNTFNQLQEFKRRVVSRNGSSGSESEFSESYQKRLQERALKSSSNENLPGLTASFSAQQQQQQVGSSKQDRSQLGVKFSQYGTSATSANTNELLLPSNIYASDQKTTSFNNTQQYDRRISSTSSKDEIKDDNMITAIKRNSMKESMMLDTSSTRPPQGNNNNGNGGGGISTGIVQQQSQHQIVPLPMKGSDGVALATRERRLRRPLMSRESDPLLPPDAEVGGGI